MTKDNAIPELTENHRRVITTMLWMLDEMLLVFERWCTTTEVHSILYDEKNDLTAEQRASILEDIASLRVLLAEMHEELQLAPHSHDIARAISVRATLFETDALHAMASKELSKYGSVSKELENYLPPKLEELVKRISNIAKTTGVSK